MPLPEHLELTFAQRVTVYMAALLFRIERASAGAVKVCRSAAEIEGAIGGGVLASVLHFEGADPIDPDLDPLDVLYQAGLRSLGLVWSRPNAFALACPSASRRRPTRAPG